MTRAANYLLALQQQPEAAEFGCGLIYMCQGDDAAADEVRNAVATETIDGMLCARIGEGQSIWPLPNTFVEPARAEWQRRRLRQEAAALVDDPTAPIAIAVRALARLLATEIQALKAGNPTPSKTWAEHVVTLKQAILDGYGDS